MVSIEFLVIVFGFVAHAFRELVIESPGVQRWLHYVFVSIVAGLGARLTAER